MELAGQLIGGVLAAAAGVLNQRLTVEDDDTWLMTDQELDTMATPLARVAARRVPLPDGSSQASDIADLVTAGVGALAYTMRNLQQAAKRRRAAAAVPLFGDVDADPGTHFDPPPAPAAAQVSEPIEAMRANGGAGGMWG